MINPLRIVFAGTPQFAADHLSHLLHCSGHHVVAVLTQPDRVAGRGKRLKASPVKELAQKNQIPIFQPDRLLSAGIPELIADLSVDVMVVVAYGQIFPTALLDSVPLGCINVHASLLPRWRGAAPIQRAIEAGDLESGISIMQMEAGLDTGPVLQQVKCALDPKETTTSLLRKLTALGISALVNTVDALAKGELRGSIQPTEGVTYANKLLKREALLDFSLPAVALERKIRAFTPGPGAYFMYQGEVIKVWEAEAHQQDIVGLSPDFPGKVLKADKGGLLIATGLGRLNCTVLQRAGRKPCPAAAFLNAESKTIRPLTIVNQE